MRSSTVNTNNSSTTENDGKRLVRRATKLQQRHLEQLLAPVLVNKSSGKKPSHSPLPPSASSSGAVEAKTPKPEENQTVEKKADAVEGELQPVLLCTNDGVPLQLECQWGTRLSQEDTDWVFQLFRRNMRNLYLKSQWGYDECMKLQELQATTSRFLILRTCGEGERSESKQVRSIGYAHFRFVEDDGRAILYCYEIQVEKEFQQKGIGSILIHLLEHIAKSTQMEGVMCTVFAFNGPSLAFFHKLGFRGDRTCLFGLDCAAGEECQGRDFVILCKRVDGKEDEEEAVGKKADGKGSDKSAICNGNHAAHDHSHSSSSACSQPQPHQGKARKSGRKKAQ